MPHTALGQHALFSIINRGLEADLAQLETAVDDLTLATRPRRARKMDRWFLGYARVFRHHHRIEHELFWSALAEAEGRELPGMAMLAEDYALLDRALDEVQKGLWTLSHVRDFVVPQQQLLQKLAEARRLLATYVAHEEEHLVAPFRARFAGDEFPPVDPRVARGLGLRGVAFAVPWGIGTMTEEERQALLPRVPLPLRAAYRLFHLPYQRKAAALDLWAPRSLRIAAA